MIINMSVPLMEDIKDSAPTRVRHISLYAHIQT